MLIDISIDILIGISIDILIDFLIGICIDISIDILIDIIIGIFMDISIVIFTDIFHWRLYWHFDWQGREEEGVDFFLKSNNPTPEGGEQMKNHDSGSQKPRRKEKPTSGIFIVPHPSVWGC